MNKRIGWCELPAEVRAGVERILQEPVIEATTQPGGFSPGTADRLRLASGRKVFVKAVSAQVNEASLTMHRRESAITANLPPGVPAPKLLGTYDDGTWVALILSDVEGRQPQLPWQDAELAQVLHALVQLAEIGLPQNLDLPRHEESLRGAFMGWEKLGRRPMADLDPWAVQKMELLVDLARHGVECLAGNSLVHGDLRADNILLTEEGAVLVDWPWASVGASWVDALSVLVNVKTMAPERDLDELVARHHVFAAVPAHDFNSVLAGLAGFFLDMSRRDPPPGIPTLRAFQRKQGDALIGWLKVRLE